MVSQRVLIGVAFIAAWLLGLIAIPPHLPAAERPNVVVFLADDLGYSLAVEIGYFFYWLDRKGYCISTKEQSIENILAFKQKGVSYYLGEVRIMQQQPGFEEEVRKNFKPIFECNGCILIKL